MKRETTSLKIDPDIWKKFKLWCIEEDLDMSEVLETLIKRKIKSPIPEDESIDIDDKKEEKESKPKETNAPKKKGILQNISDGFKELEAIP